LTRPGAHTGLDKEGLVGRGGRVERTSDGEKKGVKNQLSLGIETSSGGRVFDGTLRSLGGRKNSRKTASAGKTSEKQREGPVRQKFLAQLAESAIEPQQQGGKRGGQGGRLEKKKKTYREKGMKFPLRWRASRNGRSGNSHARTRKLEKTKEQKEGENDRPVEMDHARQRHP